MTHRECFHKVMNGEPTDWVPHYELGAWGQTIQQWFEEGMPEDGVYLHWFEGEPLFGFDRRAFAPVNVNLMPVFPHEVIEETDRYVVARGGDGVLRRALKEGTVRGTRMSMDTYLAFPVTDRKSWEDMKHRYNPASTIRYPFWWDEQARLWRDRDYPLCLLTNGAFGLYGQLRRWVGTENLSYLFYDDPALVEEMIEFCAEFLLQLVDRALKDADFDYFNFFEDCAGKGGPLYGPQIFHKFFAKSYRRITDRMRQAGIEHFWLDSDGDCEVLMPLWHDVGITCFWPLEQASGMDPVRLRKKFGKSMILCGGIDKRVLTEGKEAIDRELEAKIPPLLEQGGYIPHIDHTVQPGVPYENWLYYIERKRALLGR